MQKQKREDFRVEEELRAQKAKYEEASEDVYRRMEDIREAETESVADLTAFLDAELAYYDSCREVLLQLKRDWPASQGYAVSRDQEFQILTGGIDEEPAGLAGHVRIRHIHTQTALIQSSKRSQRQRRNSQFHASLHEPHLLAETCTTHRDRPMLDRLQVTTSPKARGITHRSECLGSRVSLPSHQPYLPEQRYGQFDETMTLHQIDTTMAEESRPQEAYRQDRQAGARMDPRAQRKHHRHRLPHAPRSLHRRRH
jgi:BAR domain